MGKTRVSLEGLEISGRGKMKLTVERSRKILAEHGAYISGACDKCGKLLAEVRFTVKGQPGEWCSRECRDGEAAAARHKATRRCGRPRKYKTNAERQRAYRGRVLGVTKPPCSLEETKGLQT